MKLIFIKLPKQFQAGKKLISGHNVIPANLFTFICVTFFILRVPRFFVGVR